jgi:voltage-gated potassium channel
MKRLFKSEISGAIFLVFCVFMAGVFGFKLFSEYTWIDAIYMTVITITTVGYGEVHPLSPNEKIFASILIISSIFIVGYAIKVISEYVLSKNNIGNFKLKRVKRTIENIEGHVIICGYGRNGKQATEKLNDYKQKFVVVEMDEEAINQHGAEDILFVHGNAIEDESLLEAGITKASTLICALPSDADNLFIVLSARQINPNLKIISRATEETSFKKLKLAGADNVILPDKIGGDHMANLVVTPDLVEFLDNLSVSGEKDSINVEQISFEKVCPGGVEKSIRELDIRKKTGCSIIGYKGSDGAYIVNPEPSLMVQKDSKLILIGRPDQIRNLKELYDA